MSRLPSGLLLIALALLATPAFGQQAAAGGQQPTETQVSDSVERIGENHIRRIGHVEIVQGDSTFYADEVEIFQDRDHAIATGNVVLSQGNNRIAAERAEFNTKTLLGTFFKAWGIATLQPPRQTRAAGIAPPTLAGAETDVYFFGETVEKIGPRKYKITNGGFSTCVQPTPRWELSSSTVVLNVDHYTLLRNAVFSVKGVPLLYTPFLYYPTKREDRATGFLIPSYGVSTIRGQSLSNAFFWAISRSQDATFMHDWFSNTGQGVGTEYRYNVGPGSDGEIKTYLLNGEGTVTSDPNGGVSTERNYEIRGTANQLLPYGFRARGRVDYFSNVTTMQTLNTNIYDMSRNQRIYGGNIVGMTRQFSVNATFDHSEYFYSDSSSSVSGSWPRISLTRNERPLFGPDLYYSIGGEVVRLLRVNNSPLGEAQYDLGLSRFDLSPQLRYPFRKWSWFTVNSTINWRDTYYTRSYLVDQTSPIVDEGLNRSFFDFRSQLIGPVFTRIWNTPESGYAERFKHTIEPYLTLSRTSAIDDYNRIVKLDGLDYTVGNTTSYTYGLNNRLYAKRRPLPNSFVRTGQAREIVSLEIAQSYYTDARAAQCDPRYSTSCGGGVPPTNFSAIALSMRALPTDQFSANMRAEIDPQFFVLRTIAAGGIYSIPNQLVATLTWSKRNFVNENVPGFNDPARLDQYINTSLNLHTRDNRIGGIYSANFDIFNSRILQQRLTGFYNAQCCGVAFEYQTYNLSFTGSSVSKDRRFFMSFTLAGLGNFSPFSGAMGGVPR
jgi:LPS-assembly protein